MAISGEKKKQICSIIRAYLLLRKEATTKELVEFINFGNFRVRGGVKTQQIPIIVKNDIKKNGILNDITIEKSSDEKIHYKLVK